MPSPLFRTPTDTLRRGLLGMGLGLACLLTAPPLIAQSNATDVEIAYWQSVSGSNDPTLLQLYLDRYPNGEFAALARAMIASQGGDAASPPAPAAPDAPDLAQYRADCDRLAAHPSDKDKLGEGVAFSELKNHAFQAIDACRQAGEDGTGRYTYQYGRSLAAAERQAEAHRLYVEAAERGYTFARMQEANNYAFGRGVARDAERAIPLFLSIAETDPRAWYRAASLRIKELGQRESHADEIVTWLGAAIDAGVALGHSELGAMIYEGLGVPDGTTEAERNLVAHTLFTQAESLGRLHDQDVPTYQLLAGELAADPIQISRMIQAQNFDILTETLMKFEPGGSFGAQAVPRQQVHTTLLALRTLLDQRSVPSLHATPERFYSADEMIDVLWVRLVGTLGPMIERGELDQSARDAYRYVQKFRNSEVRSMLMALAYEEVRKRGGDTNCKQELDGLSKNATATVRAQCPWTHTVFVKITFEGRGPVYTGSFIQTGRLFVHPTEGTEGVVDDVPIFYDEGQRAPDPANWHAARWRWYSCPGVQNETWQDNSEDRYCTGAISAGFDITHFSGQPPEPAGYVRERMIENIDILLERFAPH